MAASISLYGAFPGHLASKKIDWQGDTVKVALLTDSHFPDQDGHSLFADVSGNEVSGTGYTAGGATLSGKTSNYDPNNNTRTFDANPAEWTNSTITARYAVIYSESVDNPLIGLVDFDSLRSSSDGTFRITWNQNGIFTVTV